MRSALIGHTGFVGSNLLEQLPFDATYASRNIGDLAGQRFDLVVCAGVSAAKWIANQDPEGDRARIQPLLDALANAHIGHVVLVSTIDVYPSPDGVDEDSRADFPDHHAYGRHRREVEHFVMKRFGSTVVRLPGLFGKGLKKNVIYDMLHDNQVDKIDPDAAYQYYDLRHVGADLERARKLAIPLLNIATPAIRTGEVAAELFGLQLPEKPGPHVRYDMQTRHGQAWGRPDRYLYGRDDVWRDLQAFVASERSRLQGAA